VPTPVVGISPWFTTAAQAKNICQANLYTAFKDEMIDGAGGGRSMRHAGWRRAGVRPAAVGGTVTSGPVDGPQVTSAVAWDAGRGTGQIRVEVALAAAAFAVLCVTVLKVAPRLVEPDDYAYRGSILAITQGHLLTLSTAQARALAGQLAPATRSSRHRSRRWASSGWRRCFTGRWAAWACSRVRGAGWGVSAARRPSACSAPRARRCCSPGVITWRPSPMRR
jgi:hypothetical protein